MSIGNHLTKFMDIRVGTELALIQVEHKQGEMAEYGNNTTKSFEKTCRPQPSFKREETCQEQEDESGFHHYEGTQAIQES